MKNIEKIVKQTIKKVTNVDVLDTEHSLTRDYNINELLILEILETLEHELDITINDNDMLTLSSNTISINELIETIKNYTNG